MFKQVVCVALVALFAVAAAAEMNLPEKDMQSIFTGYMQRHNKVYAREEFFHRYGVFKANYAKILAHNALPEDQQKGIKMGTNKLSDLTSAEYKKLLGLKKDGVWGAGNEQPMPEGDFADDASLDWRSKGAVNAVKDQGQCGGCWAFSAVASTEAAVFIAGNKLPNLSEQELIDCSTDSPYYCQGCDGCLMHTAFQYIIDHKGLCTEKEYPFTGEDGTCSTKKCTSTKVPIKSYKNVTCDDENFCDEPLIAANETTMLTYVNKGVLSIALEADSDVFQNYESGVLDDDSCGTQLDHGVAIVGYGTDSKYGKYWLVRNSWGASWGEEGYIRIAQGKNMCGLALYSNQPYAK